MLKRPNGQGGVSRTKVSAVILALWGAVAPVAGVPQNIVEGVTGALVGLTAIFLRDGMGR